MSLCRCSGVCGGVLSARVGTPVHAHVVGHVRAPACVPERAWSGAHVCTRACGIGDPGEGLNGSAQDGARWRRSGAEGEGGSAVCLSVLLLGRQADGQTVPLQNTPTAAPREVQMLGDILSWFPFARGAGDTEDTALLLSSQAGSGDGAPRHVGRDRERLGCGVEVPGGSWSQFLEEESFLREGKPHAEKTPAGGGVCGYVSVTPSRSFSHVAGPRGVCAFKIK